MRQHIIPAVCFVFSTILAAAVSFGAVTGTVTDKNGDPVADATVTFIQENHPGNTVSAVTASDGGYSIGLTVGVGDDTDTPRPFHLGQNYPNPFNPATTIPFALDARSRVTLTVYNIMGQRIAMLVNSEMEAGQHTLTWNGMDEAGNHVSTGVYLKLLSLDIIFVF